MRARDYVSWIWNESRSSVMFTALNVFGILINTCVLIVFLSLAFGVESATINSITEEVNMWTLTVLPQNNQRLRLNDLAFLPREQIIGYVPQLDEFVDLRPFSPQPPTEDDPAFVSAYLSNFYVGDTGIDPRTANLTFVRGRNLSAQDEGTMRIVVSESVFSRIAAKTTGLSLDTFEQIPVDLVVYRLENRTERVYSRWPVIIVGIATSTPFSDRQIFGTEALARLVDNAVNPTTPSTSIIDSNLYEKFLIIARDITALESLRSAIETRGFDTQSVLDRIDNVRSFVGIIRSVFLVVFSAAIVIAAFNLVITLISYVMKRRKDIGILKSIGATNQQVQTIFVLHALYLCIVGSVLGVGTSFLVMQILQAVLNQLDDNLSSSIFEIKFGYVLIVVAVGLLLSAVAASIPARRAAMINPIETLREQ